MRCFMLLLMIYLFSSKSTLKSQHFLEYSSSFTICVSFASIIIITTPTRTSSSTGLGQLCSSKYGREKKDRVGAPMQQTVLNSSLELFWTFCKLEIKQNHNTSNLSTHLRRHNGIIVSTGKWSSQWTKMCRRCAILSNNCVEARTCCACVSSQKWETRLDLTS